MLNFAYIYIFYPICGEERTVHQHISQYGNEITFTALLKWSRNNNGTKMEPWGTPEKISV